MIKINNSVRLGGLTFAAGVTCGAIAFAVKESPFIVFYFTLSLATVFGILAAAQIEE